jgi:LmbE family N-acetylglucosaminyl deacetylase
MGESLTFSGKRVAFIGAHPDDIELGAGALISQIVSQAEIRCVTLSDNQKNPDLRHLVDEHYASMAILGVPPEKVILGQFETRRFPHARQEILEYMIQLNTSFKPDIVFVHTKADIHQDHGTVTEEALRAFRGTTVLGFDVIRSSYGFFPNFLVEVSPEEVDKKVRSLEAYTTYSSRYYFNAELTRSTLIRYGAIAERPYAEGFDILRVIGKFGCIR